MFVLILVIFKIFLLYTLFHNDFDQLAADHQASKDTVLPWECEQQPFLQLQDQLNCPTYF